MKMFTPLPNWSHLEVFRWTFMIDGWGAQSNDTSPHDRYDCLSALGARSSPRRKKPKKQRDATAQNRHPSLSDDQ